MKNKIIVVGDIASDNLGDPLLVQNFASLLTQQGADVVTWDINNKDYTISAKSNVAEATQKSSSIKKSIHQMVPKFAEEFFYYKKAKVDWDSLNNRLMQKDIDKIIFAGGQMLMSYYAHQIVDIVNIAEKHDVPVYFNAMGVGTLKNKIIKRDLKCALKRPIVKSLTVRDNVSFIESMLGEPVTQCIDSVAMANYVYEGSTQERLVGIGVIYRVGKEKEIKDQLKIVIEEVESAGFEWEFFSNGGIDDYSFGISILNELGYSSDKMAERPTTSLELIKLVTKYQRIVSYRLHSHIIAYAYGIPSFGFAWDKKVMEFFNLIEMPTRVASLSGTEDLTKKIANIGDWSIDGNRKSQLIEHAMVYIKIFSEGND